MSTAVSKSSTSMLPLLADDESRHHDRPATHAVPDEIIVLFTAAEIAGLLTCFFQSIELDGRAWLCYYFFLNAISYPLQLIFQYDAYPARLCRYAAFAALGIAIAPLTKIGWAHIFGIPVAIG